MASGEQRWRELAERVAGDAGFDLEEFSVVTAGRRRVVRVVVDSDTGVALDAAAELSRALSEQFDAAEENGQSLGSAPYTLEVTSPGIGRPLTQPRHFRRARARLLSLTKVDGQTLSVRVLGTTDDGVDLLGGKSGTDPLHLRFDEIAKARVEVEFGAPSAAVAALLAADPRTADVLARSAQDAAAVEQLADDEANDDSANDDSANDEDFEDADLEDVDLDDEHDDEHDDDDLNDGETKENDR